jgi:hypothetical protein
MPAVHARAVGRPDAKSGSQERDPHDSGPQNQRELEEQRLGKVPDGPRRHVSDAQRETGPHVARDENQQRGMLPENVQKLGAAAAGVVDVREQNAFSSRGTV